MIKVEWRIHYVTHSGDEKQTVYFARSPRVPRVGDYVDGLKVTRVEWSEDMESATIELRES